MYVSYIYDEGILSTEVPCEADPIPFALKLIQEAHPEWEKRSQIEDELKNCKADGSPLKD